MKNPHLETLIAAMDRCMRGEAPPEPGSEAWDRLFRAIHVFAKAELDRAKIADIIAFGSASLQLLADRLGEHSAPPVNVLQTPRKR